MSDQAVYLVTPAIFDPAAIATRLDPALATGVVGCVRLALASTDEADWHAAAGPLRDVTAAHDVALVIADHFRLVRVLGLDGVHLTDERTPLRDVRKALGPDRIVGAFAGTSRHQGMVLAEAGADYVSFGPVGDAGGLGPDARADLDLFRWWTDVIETPLVAEGAVGLIHAKALAGLADFVVPDLAIWKDEDIAGSVRSFADAVSPAAVRSG